MINKFGIWLIFFHLQDISYCLPSSSPCYTAVSTTDTYNCSVSCTGLYADVEFTEDQVLVDSVQKELTQLVAIGNLLI